MIYLVILLNAGSHVTITGNMHIRFPLDRGRQDEFLGRNFACCVTRHIID